MKRIFSLFFIFNVLLSFSQDKSRDGDYFLERKGYIEAISVLEPQFQKNPTQKVAIQLADAFLHIKKYEKALSYYETALTMAPLTEEQMSNYFSALYEYGDVELARQIATSYKVKYGKSTLLSKLDSAEFYRKQDLVYIIRNLPMNTKSNDYGLYSMYGEYKILNSDIDFDKEDKGSKELGKKYLDPYIINVKDTNSLTPEYMPIVTANNKFHDAVSHYDPTERKIYLTRSNSNKYNLKPNTRNLSTLKIYIATIDSNFHVDNYTEFAYNSNDYSVGHPTVSSDGEILYFVSDKPGGFGGTDLYRCMKLQDGSWGFPINLGANVNTTGDEMFPYISPQGTTLYFASTGHSIFGGFDLNKTEKTRYHAFSKPTNLGIPFNSSKDDFAITFSDKYGTEGFFSSNRPEGKGGDDIYYFGYFNNKICTEPVKNFTIKVIDKKNKMPIQSVHIKMTVKLDGKVYEDETDANGEIHLRVEGCTDFDVEATHDLYLNNDFYYDGFKKSVTIELDKKELNNIIALEKIYYELGKYDVHPAAASQLSKLSILLKKNPDVKIELSSHTDSRGEDAYNLTLSQKRADHIVKFLETSGIARDRMVAIGYGETKLANECKNNVPCTEEQHEKNRRTEFKILEIAPTK